MRYLQSLYVTGSRQELVSRPHVRQSHLHGIPSLEKEPCSLDLGKYRVFENTLYLFDDKDRNRYKWRGIPRCVGPRLKRIVQRLVSIKHVVNNLIRLVHVGTNLHTALREVTKLVR